MSLRVVEAGLLTTVQDVGRTGWAHLGVPRAGWLDAPSARLANRLVGNDEATALLETTASGASFLAERACTVAVTGARSAVTVGSRRVAFGEPVPVPAGALVAVGPATEGVRSYVAVGGGIAVEPVLGSRSTDTLAYVGPPPLAPGMRLPLGAAVGEPVWVDVPPREPPRRAVLRLHPGPRADRLAAPGLSGLDGTTYRVGTASNRVGLRLEGPVLARAREEELPSEGIVLGAVQVPPSGQPVVFLNDHPVTGGYPVVAVVDPADLAHCAQARPGDELVLRLAR